MTLSYLLLQKIVSMVLMMLIGFAIVKAGILKSEHSSVLSKVILYAVSPCMILSSFQLDYTAERLKGLLLAAAACIAAMIVLILFAKVLGKMAGLDGTERASIIYSNGGNLIVPLVSSLLGSEYVFYCCAFIMITIFLGWTHLPKLENPDYKIRIKKILMNPCIIAIAAGMIFFFARIKFPSMIADTLSSMSATIGPMSMVMVGMLLADVDMKAAFTNVRSYIVVFARLIVSPLLFILMIRLSGITADAAMKQVLLVTELAISAPVAVNVIQMANLFGGDAEKASAINVMSIFLCIVTMPLMVMVYQYIC